MVRKLTRVLSIFLISTAPALALPEENSSKDFSKQDIIATVGNVEFRECLISGGTKQRKVQCSQLEVQENPNETSGTSIHLTIVRLPARRTLKTPKDPMLFISGGPGQAATETFLYADLQYAPLAKEHDFYLIDQRGTGLSNKLTCPNQDERLTMELTYSKQALQKFYKNCLAKLESDVKHYTTDVTVRDFEQVRKALGIKQWNLLGVSYGTRVSTHYMRTFPNSIRTAVLDSVVPPQHRLGSEIALQSQNALDELFSRCETSSRCQKAMPNLRLNVEKLIQRLKDGPIQIEYEDFKTGKKITSQFTLQHLTTLIRMHLYSPYSMAILPPMLQQAAVEENFSAIARAASNIEESLSESLTIALHNSVVCTEDFPGLSKATVKDSTSYLGSQIQDILTDTCEVWPRGQLTENFHSPLTSDIPTLLLSGEFDPITPPSYAEQTKSELTNATHLSLQGQGHFVSHVGCTPNIIDQFVSRASSKDLHINCLKRLSASPLFYNFNSPSP